MNRSKQKGTAWETACARYLQVERRTLQGKYDKGDLSIPGIVVECKNAQRFALAEWLDEAALEAANAGVQDYIVWAKRRGTTNPGECYVITTGDVFWRIWGEDQ